MGIDPDAPLPGERGLRIILFGAIALFGIPAVLGAGIAAGYPIIGIVLAVALGAVCLLFAAARGPRVIEPNRLSLPGEAAARAAGGGRLRGDRPDRRRSGCTAVVADRASHGDERDRLVGTLEGAVAAAGRDELLDEARDSVRNALYHAADLSLSGRAVYGISMHTTGRADDRVELRQPRSTTRSRVAVAEDLLDAGRRAGARRSRAGRCWGCRRWAATTRMGAATRAGGTSRGSPTATDWAEAAGSGGHRPGRATPRRARPAPDPVRRDRAVRHPDRDRRRHRRTTSRCSACSAALAIGAVCWTFATFRRAR